MLKKLGSGDKPSGREQRCTRPYWPVGPQGHLNSNKGGGFLYVLKAHSNPVSWELHMTRDDPGETGEQSLRRLHHHIWTRGALGSHWGVSALGAREEVCVENVLENNSARAERSGRG